MLKTIVRFLLILLIAIVLGVAIFHYIQPSGQVSFGSGFSNSEALRGDFGGDRGFREGGFGLIGGLAGITGNLILVSIVTFIIVAIQNLFRERDSVTA